MKVNAFMKNQTFSFPQTKVYIFFNKFGESTVNQKLLTFKHWEQGMKI